MMVKSTTVQSSNIDMLRAAVDSAIAAIPPAWPLASSVAVNPYLGQTHKTLAETGALLARVSGTAVTMTREYYRNRVSAGDVLDEDITNILSSNTAYHGRFTVAAIKAALDEPSILAAPLPTMADLAASLSGIDWPQIIAERFGVWAAGYFDEGQALWSAPKMSSAYAAWTAGATHDLTPEIAGLKGFAAFVAGAPLTGEESIAASTEALGLTAESMPTYFHALLVSLGGWAQYARYEFWQATLVGKTNIVINDLLAIRLLWEHALFAQYADQLGTEWLGVLEKHAAPVEPSQDQIVDAIMQEACERAAQRKLATTLSAPKDMNETAPAIQAAFCIDVRSEVFRRAFESIDPRIQTLGFAGFFGLTTSHKRFASEVSELRLPVLLNPGVHSRSGTAQESIADNAARYSARATRAWGRFKLAAVSSFAFVEAAGPIYIAKLLRDTFGLPAKHSATDPAPSFDPPLELTARTNAAASILRAMSLTDGFASLVLLVGHGANVVNNPHASALHCGACGGYSGEVNARLLAGLLNDAAVREALVADGINIPAETLFVGGLHDTTTDAVTLYTKDHVSAAHGTDIERAQTWLATAGSMARGERALRLPRAQSGEQVTKRSHDWAETRPEWALAGCSAFIAAPRSRTKGKSLQGRAFLHDYDWRADRDFGVLELIMTAPVVVASWISLQYYGSTVAPALFGGGNKLLHNVVGGIGVVEGNGGLLRAGLPWQSVFDGEKLAHEPLRLSVCIEAPREAMTAILKTHPDVRALFDNQWLYLFALDDRGAMAWRYCGNLKWEAVEQIQADARPGALAA